MKSKNITNWLSHRPPSPTPQPHRTLRICGGENIFYSTTVHPCIWPAILGIFQEKQVQGLSH